MPGSVFDSRQPFSAKRRAGRPVRYDVRRRPEGISPATRRLQPLRPMASSPDVTDHEALFRMVYDRRWADVLAFVHRHRASIEADALLSRAVETFAAAFLDEGDRAGSAG